mgnify:CR=1 FL=1|tara:strand:+ start:680 stop:1369 length:690 start_codon:yes stop_codon:yes gene_type:complete
MFDKENSRYEIKFITHDTNYYLLKNWIRINDLVLSKEYDNRKINNIYFDTHNYTAYKSNIYGNSSRLKIRYRWYGNFFDNNLGNLEFKIKRNVYGHKVRFPIENLKINKEINWKNIILKINQNLSAEYKNIFNSQCVPMIINKYEREYYKSKNQKVRVTIDKDIYNYDQRRNIIKPNLDNKTFSQKYLVIEIKFDRSHKKFFENFSINTAIKLSKNSKYINGVRAVTGI